MLAFYHALAVRLHRLRALLWLLAGACVAGFVALVLGDDDGQAQHWLMGVVVALIWSISALSVTYGFVKPLPEAGEGAGFVKRLKTSLLRAYLWTMALLASVATLGALALTVRAVGIALR